MWRLSYSPNKTRTLSHSTYPSCMGYLQSLWTNSCCCEARGHDMSCVRFLHNFSTSLHTNRDCCLNPQFSNSLTLLCSGHIVLFYSSARALSSRLWLRIVFATWWDCHKSVLKWKDGLVGSMVCAFSLFFRYFRWHLLIAFCTHSYNSRVYSRNRIVYLHSWALDLLGRELVLATAHSGKHG